VNDDVGVPPGVLVWLIVLAPKLSVKTGTGPGPGYCADADWLNIAHVEAAAIATTVVTNSFLIFMTLTTPSYDTSFYPCA